MGQVDQTIKGRIIPLRERLHDVITGSTPSKVKIQERSVFIKKNSF